MVKIIEAKVNKPIYRTNVRQVKNQFKIFKGSVAIVHRLPKIFSFSNAFIISWLTCKILKNRNLLEVRYVGKCHSES